MKKPEIVLLLVGVLPWEQSCVGDVVSTEQTKLRSNFYIYTS